MSARAWNIAGLVAVGALGLAAMVGLPLVLELSALLDVTVYLIMAILALSLALVWGYGGVLCFGQSAFFGLGAYAYAITMFNVGESTLPFLVAILLPAAFGALLGYFMFYGRISDVYLGVITLTVTLILFNAVNSTAGPEYRIGDARLGGFNGIPSIPPLNLPGNPEAPLDLNDMFYLSLGLLLAVYFGLRWLLVSRFGRVMVAIRENERRAEFLGYDARLYKLLVFTIGGGLAGLAGCLFANWGAFVSPTIFGLSQSAQIIIWVIVGGRGTLIGPVVGCIAIQWLTASLGSMQLASGGAVKASWMEWAGPGVAKAVSSVLGIVDLSNASLVLGAILLAFVLLVPKGITPALGDGRSLLGRSRRAEAGNVDEGDMTGPAVLLETRELGMRFGGVQAVSGVNFRLLEGELRCLIGPNGAGKSTFFKLLTGQLAPTHGQVLYRGRDISGAETHQVARLGIGIKTQVPSVFDGLSVRENIWVAARRGRTAQRTNQLVDEILTRIAMTGAADRLVAQLAHGQRQWLELGVVLAAEPELILLDEPAAGMTHEEVLRTADLIRDINRTRSLIVVEHDMQFIRMIASQVTVLDQGQVLVEDSMENILRNPRVRDVYLGKRVAA